MTLESFFAETETTQADLARKLGVSPGRLNHWVVGRHDPPINMIRPIEKATKGMVTRVDLLPEVFA